MGNIERRVLRVGKSKNAHLFAIGVRIAILSLALLAKLGATAFTYVTIPTSNNIQTALISTIPTGTFTANNTLATPFSISAAPGKCGPSGNSPCNYYDGFGFSGSGKSITMEVDVASPTDVYTLMNAYQPAGGQQLATIKFVGSGGASLTFALIGGQDIRDYYQGSFSNSLTNGVAGVQALNAFSCTDPATCRGSGATLNVATGLTGSYVVDEQHFSLGATFAGQTLTEITLTDTYNGSNPILLGVTVGSAGTGILPSGIPQFTISTVAGDGTAGYSGDGGAALSASINSPFGVAADNAGNFYIADFTNERIRKVSLGGVITTIAGNGSAGYGGDGGPATSAMLSRPSHVTVDAGGNLYIADSGNSRVRKVTPDGTITTIAGNGVPAEGGDGGPATSASLYYPEDAVADSAGNVYIADGDGNTIRMVSADGIITTVAGNGQAGFSGDGGRATNAALNNPTSVAVDGSGNLYIGDTNNNAVRKVANGIITTIAGTGARGFAGDGGPATAAKLSGPTARLDPSGNIYIADSGNFRVRVVLTSNIIWTVAGDGTRGFSGDGGPATNANLIPAGVAVTNSGGVYIADPADDRIRLLTPALQAPSISSGGVVSASAFGEFTSISPGSWIEIYGSNLAADSRSWTGADFTGINAPTSLDGTSVTIGGQSAFIDYISPGQVNALVPSNVATGTQPMIVTAPGGTSATYNVTVNPVEPGLLAPSSFNVGGTQYAVALFSDGTYVLPAGAIAGINSRPAMPGDEIVLYGVGFGPVTPAMPAGQLVQEANTLASDYSISIGGMLVASVPYAGLAPSYTGLYQFNIVVPPEVGSGAVALTFMVDGVAGTQALYLAVEN